MSKLRKKEGVTGVTQKSVKVDMPNKEFLTPEQALDEPVSPVEVWLLSWNARRGNYSSDTKRVAKAFTREEDAEAYKELLKRAKKVLQDTDDIEIKIEKQI